MSRCTGSSSYGVHMSGYFDLTNRVALITGASRGLGLAMAEALAEVGATVILNGRDANTLKVAADRGHGWRLADAMFLHGSSIRRLDA